MIKKPLIIIIVALFVGMVIVLFGQFKLDFSGSNSQSVQNVEIIDGVQYVTINARGGYSPRVSFAKANMPTKLIVKTNGTYDCSLALTIRSIGYQKILSQTGEEIIDLGIPNKDSIIQGTCSMGMYNFKLNFN